jgi:CheY-like chemotaxis protein
MMAKVLVVEDTADLRTLSRCVSGRAATRAERRFGEEALSVLAAKGRPDVAILDVVMPG